MGGCFELELRLDEPPACESQCWATKRERTVRRHLAVDDPGGGEVKHEGSPRARNAQHRPHAVEWYAAWRAAHFPVSG